MSNPKHSTLALTIALVLAAPLPAVAQSEGAQDEARELDQVVVTGTRVAGRSATDTAVPLDVVDVAQLERTGSPELNQALSVTLPSFKLTAPTRCVRPHCAGFLPTRAWCWSTPSAATRPRSSTSTARWVAAPPRSI